MNKDRTTFVSTCV